MTDSKKIFSVQYRVYYEDTDAGGVVYYANYLKFFERARTDFLRSLNILQSEIMTTKNILFVVKKCQIEYFSPARLDDLIEVFVEVKEIKNVSILIEQKICLAEKLLSSLEVQIACVCADNFRPKKIPESIKDLLKLCGG